MERDTDDSGRAVWDALQRLVRELIRRKPGAHVLESRLDAVELRAPLYLRGERAEPGRFARELAASLDGQLARAIEQAAAFRPGHAFCHRCGRADCEHSLPPSCRHVFVGYAPTGQPRWADFAQYCLERKHADVDRLYEAPPALLTVIEDRRGLHGAMLSAFRSVAHEVVGQVAAGFFTVSTRADEGRGVIAVTVQVVATGNGGSRRLATNVLGRPPFGDSLADVWQRHDELPWRKAVLWVQAAIETVTVSKDLGRRVDGILHGLARRLEREQRGRARRTHHAERRRASGVRPTNKAVDDARSAVDDAFLVDERSGTVVVLGDRGRTHFFTPEGRLVSSVRYSRDAIERKLKLELWRRAPPEITDALRAKLPV